MNTSNKNSLREIFKEIDCDANLPEITAEQLHAQLGTLEQNHILLIDVRRPEEFNNELGHIPGAQLKTLGEELTEYLRTLDISQRIIFICRSGGRSGTATLESHALGLSNTVNLQGGMLYWNAKQFFTNRNEEN